MYPPNFHRECHVQFGSTDGIPASGADSPSVQATGSIWESIAAQAIDALPSRIAVVGADGVILAVNLAWRTFAHRHGASDADACEGRNFFSVCAADGEDDVDHQAALDVSTGLRQVLEGASRLYTAEEPCHINGELLWTSVTISRVNGGDSPLAVVAYDDITERKRIELALRDTEQAHDRAQRIARVGSWVADFEQRQFAPSREGLALLGWEPGPHTFDELFALIHPDDRAAQAEAWGRAIATRSDFSFEHRMTLRGDVRWVHVVAEFAYAPDGRVLRAFGVTQDITEHKQAQFAIAEERTRLRTLLDAIPDVVFVKDVEGRYLLVNPALEQLLGVPSSSILGRTDSDLFPPDAASLYRKDDESVAATGESMRREEQLSIVPNEWITMQTVKTPVYLGGQLAGVLGIARDVTVERRVGAALAESERQKQFALDAAQLGTWHHRGHTDTLTLDARAMAIWDVDEPTHRVRDLVLARVHADDVGKLAGPTGPSTPGPHSVEFRIRRRDGDERWALAHLQLSFAGDASDPVDLDVHGTIQDITERKRAEAMMNRFVSANPALLYALGVVDGGYPVRWFSGNLESLTGWSRDAVLDPFWWANNLHPDDRDLVVAANHKVVEQGHWIQEFRFKRPDGNYLWVRDEKRLLRDGEGRPAEIVGSWSDITERVALEAQVRQSHKLEAIGLLAGGVAHDFNNLLTVIGGNADLLRSHVEMNESARMLLSDIRDAGERAGSLTRQLLAFSRTQVLAPKTVSLNAVVTRMQSMLMRLISEDIRFECTLDDDAGYVRVDEGQFEQVLVNLAVNARDAMPRGGRLLLRTGRTEVDEAFRRHSPDVAPGIYATLAVVDSGTGMSPETVARIFEPFFTTKESGRGTGLGLATVFGTVKQSGGHIDVQSRLGSGSTFTVYLPQVPPDTAAATTRTDAAPRHGHETVLLVEDEESLRKLARLALERSGYTVLCAPNGLAALEVAERHRNAIDLLLTDVVMPEMRGTDLAHVLRRRQPNLRVLFISGYVPAMADRADVSEANFLLKPFTLRDLSEKVRSVLDAS